MLREFGSSIPKGTIYAINPFLVMILTPLLSAVTKDVDPLVMIHHGCYISVASVFVLVFSTSVPACILFVSILSIGEATWSPRLYDFTMAIAKEGREGTYMALASSPIFLAKLPVGLLSGYLLQAYCPENGPRQSKIMWLIIGLTSAMSPFVLTLCWRFISSYNTAEGVVAGASTTASSTKKTVISSLSNNNISDASGDGKYSSPAKYIELATRTMDSDSPTRYKGEVGRKILPIIFRGDPLQNVDSL